MRDDDDRPTAALLGPGPRLQLRPPDFPSFHGVRRKSSTPLDSNSSSRSWSDPARSAA
jgi:hypothetical protein